MVIKIDFNSDEAIYMQLRNQIIMGIATNEFRNGDPLPSVRNLADDIGVNRHTVNKAYSVLRQEGYVKVDRRRGACISVDPKRSDGDLEIRKPLAAAIARASCRGMTREQIHSLVDEILDEDFGGGNVPIADGAEDAGQEAPGQDGAPERNKNAM